MINVPLQSGIVADQHLSGGPTIEYIVGGGILISYHCPLFPWGTVVGRFAVLPDGNVRSRIHPDIEGLPLDQLHLYGIEVIKINADL